MNSPQIRHYYDGVEFTTRTRLCDEFGVSKSNMQYFLENSPELTTVVEGNKYYYLKSEVESLLCEWLTSTGRKTITIF